MSERIEIYEKQGTKWRMFIGLIAAVAVCLWLVTSIDGPPMYFGIVGLILFVPVSIKFFSIALDSRPRLVLDDIGFEYRGSHCGIVEWTDIVGILQSEIQKQPFLAVYVEDPEKYLSRLTPRQRKFFDVANSVNNSFGFVPRLTDVTDGEKPHGYPPVQMGFGALNIKPEELIGLMNTRIEAATQHSPELATKIGSNVH